MRSSVFSKSVPDKFPIHPDIHQYPAYDSFLKPVQQEAEQHVKRLRHHPSLVVFGGCAKNSFGLIFILSRYFFPQLEITRVRCGAHPLVFFVLTDASQTTN
jgi:hypothetical protein